MKGLDFKRIGLKIKEIRKSRNLTQEYIGNRLDVNASHISNIEGGRAHPSLTALVQIANVLECSIDCFLKDEYTFDADGAKTHDLEDQIIEKIRYFSPERKEKVLKMLDLL